MVKKLDPRLIEVFKKYGVNAEEALWDCHGTWVAYHKDIEFVAAKAGVIFEPPTVYESDATKGIVSLHVVGKLGDMQEWSFGECNPKNNKNAYPYAMAEKRAKDRVVLKLVGLHGLVYSEEESDDFKPKSSAQLKRDGVWENFMKDLVDCNSMVTLDKLKAEYRIKAMGEGWNKIFLDSMREEFEKKEEEFVIKQETELLRA